MSEKKSNRSGRRNRSARGTTLRKHHGIDHVMVQEVFGFRKPAQVAEQGDNIVGDGCYISATVNNKRYYGLLVDQASLRAASMLYFQDEASGLELNQRMDHLLRDRGKELGEAQVDSSMKSGDRKRPATVGLSPTTGKRMKLSMDETGHISDEKQVQKFLYVMPSENGSSLGYRILLATFANVYAAAEDDEEKSKQILDACDAGGSFVGKYYYQYEVKCLALEADESDRGGAQVASMRMSMGFQSFLRTTELPPWFPLSNIQVDQQKVLSLLKMKRDNNGNAVVDTSRTLDSPVAVRVDLTPMKPRSHFRVIVIGGGISGLSCCREIFRECERENIPVEVVLLEGRNRFGGRLWTDRETFKSKDGGKVFPVDLGASWIHGIDHNPLAALAMEAGVEFVTSSEDVKMLKANMEEIDPESDERAGAVFDKLLDLAAEDCWKSASPVTDIEADQVAVRWYASMLNDFSDKGQDARPLATHAPLHRQSGDISVDRAIGRAVAKTKLSEFSKLTIEERRMLMWNLKNVEYALGANISDLSMRFWDIDERHAFGGEHVILREGYSTIVDYMVEELKSRGDRFRYKLNFPVGEVEYARRTSTQTCVTRSNRPLVELSDSCRVTSDDGSAWFDGDFVVSCLPLGVLKAALAESDQKENLKFVPPLPFPKQDAISNVGFGLLDKVYLQFSTAFWRTEDALGDHHSLFGNASGTNPHHYMFFDIGRTLEAGDSKPAVLMSLISGREAVKCELLTEKELVDETVSTLRVLFAGLSVPEPIAYRVSRWGRDRFSRGSYTFLPPGTTDQDFELLQTPINGNGDSLLLEGSETMRLFFAGEHTTALHPSMAHGALLSGVRAAKQVLSAMSLSVEVDESIDRLIPMPLFRHLNPTSSLECSMCHRSGTTIREGTLLSFKKGSRQALVHNNCAENSPEVEVFEGQWKNVFRAINRSRSIECSICGREGASIGCAHSNCYRCYHFSCAEDTGWRFDRDGKEYFCDLHRTISENRTERVSLTFCSSVRGKFQSMVCDLCGEFGKDTKNGPLLAYQKGTRITTVHEKCVKFSTVCDIGEDKSSRLEHEYRRIFDVLSLAKKCEMCSKDGATISCAEPVCSFCFHFPCALKTEWDFRRRPQFRCQHHRHNKPCIPKVEVVGKEAGPVGFSPGNFQHSLFSFGSSNANRDVPGNLDIDNRAPLELGADEMASDQSVSSSDEEDSMDDSGKQESESPYDQPKHLRELVKDDFILTPDFDGGADIESRLSRLFRKSTADLWNVEFYVTRLTGSSREAVLSVALARPDAYDEIRDGDIVTTINGIPVGSPDLDTLEKVLSRLSQETDAMIEVKRLSV